jgi:hypothetical protein
LILSLACGGLWRTPVSLFKFHRLVNQGLQLVHCMTVSFPEKSRKHFMVDSFGSKLDIVKFPWMPLLACEPLYDH